MLETGAILVPTRTIIQEILDSRAAPPYAQAKLEALADRHAHDLALAREAGMTVAMGSDILSPAPSCRCRADATTGSALLTASGLSPLAAIEAATANGPATLGPQAPRGGQLTAGYDADVLVLDVNPVTDVTVFAKPKHITGVWKAGRRVKGVVSDRY
jgi:imidazolonepropionase-like amidohydrolase